MNHRFLLCVACVVSSVISATAAAQEDAAKEGAKSAKAQYEAKLTEWKDHLQTLRQLHQRFSVAEEKEVPEIRKQFTETVAIAETLIPDLKKLGLAAFKESPNTDRDLMRFLIKMSIDFRNKDQYDDVAEITDGLIAGGADHREIWNLAGIAAFVQHDFAKAKKYLTEANSLGSIEPKGTEYLNAVDQVAELWKEEQKIRKAEAEADDLPRVKLTTTKGDIVMELFENEAPETVGNFISLVEKGFYTDLTFHRVLPGFMAQTGCPVGDGSGGPGYRIYCEVYQDNARNHWTGSLSMAKGQQRDSGGSQFFITQVPTVHLNGMHTVFGRVIEGLDLIPKIKRRDPSAANAATITPDRVLKAEVIRKREHAYVPNKVQ